MKILTMFVAVAAVGLTACTQTQPASSAAASVAAEFAPSVVYWQCGQKEAIFKYLGDTEANLMLDGVSTLLKRSESASGERFVAVNDPGFVFWTKGESAQFEYKKTNISCKRTGVR